MNHPRRLWGGRGILLALAVLGLSALPVAAPSAAAPGEAVAPAASAEAVTVQDLEALLGALENEAERDKLAAQLRAFIAARAAAEAPPEGLGARLLGAISGWVDETSGKIVRAAGAILDAPELLRWVGKQVRDPQARARGLTVLVKLFVVLGLGVAAEWLVRFALRRPRRAIEARAVDSAVTRWTLLLARTGLDVAPVLGFAVAAYGVLPFTEPGVVTRAVALALVNAIVLARTVLVVTRMALAPQAAALRPVPLSDESANYAALWARRLTKTAVYGYFAAEAALLLGLPAGGHTTLLNLLGAVVAAMLLVLVLQNRTHVRTWIRGAPGAEEKGRLGALRRVLGDIWHILAILYIAAIFVVWVLRIEGGFTFVLTATLLTVVILAAARLVAEVAERVVNTGFAVSDDLKRRFPGLEGRANRYLPVVHGAIKLAVYGIAVLALFQVWGIDVLAVVTSDLGRGLVGTVISIGFVLAVALAVWEGAGLYVERYLARLDSEEVSTGRGARAKTLLPLLRNVLMIALVVVVGLTVLAQLGIDITPLLAGAGIVGLAIGLGSQKLVQDLINGFSLVLQNTISVGDVVTLGDHGGLVEAISLRNVRLRDLGGNVHTIPLGEVGSILNRTRDFSYYVFDIGIAYKENVDRVIAVLKDLGAELQADNTFGPNILEPLEVLGLDRFDESAVIIKARIKTLPIKQWLIGREFNRRMKQRFDELGIEIPFPHRTVFFGEETPEDVERLAAAPRPSETATDEGAPVEGDGA